MGKTETYEKVKKWLESEALRDVLAKSLPSGIHIEAWTSAALTAIRTDNKLMQAEPLSVLGALMEVASMGLRLEGPMGEAWISPRAKKEKNEQTGRWEWVGYEAQVQVGYRGMIALAWRDPNVVDIESEIVHARDHFDFKRGTNQFIDHTWDVNDDRGPMVAVYSGVRYRDGYYSFRVYGIKDVLELRDNILKDKYIFVEKTADGSERYMKMDNGREKELSWASASKQPWIGHPRPMIMKTSIRWSAKYWKLTPDFNRAAALVSLDDAGLSQDLASAAAAVLPSGLLDQTKGTVPQAGDGDNTASAAQVKTLARSQDLQKMMLEQAAGRAQGGDDEPPPEMPEPDKTPQDEPAPQQDEPEPQDPDQGEQPAQAEPGPQGDGPEMSQEEKDAIIAEEREQWEREQAGKGRTHGSRRKPAAKGTKAKGKTSNK